jgi:hypothetical protein
LTGGTSDFATMMVTKTGTVTTRFHFLHFTKARHSDLAGPASISYPEPSLSGSGHTDLVPRAIVEWRWLWVRDCGHTGLKNDPDWSIHKLLDPYPLWRSRARPI